MLPQPTQQSHGAFAILVYPPQLAPRYNRQDQIAIAQQKTSFPSKSGHIRDTVSPCKVNDPTFIGTILEYHWNHNTQWATGDLVDGPIGEPEPKLPALADGFANDLGAQRCGALKIHVVQ